MWNTWTSWVYKTCAKNSPSQYFGTSLPALESRELWKGNKYFTYCRIFKRAQHPQLEPDFWKCTALQQLSLTGTVFQPLHLGCLRKIWLSEFIQTFLNEKGLGSEFSESFELVFIRASMELLTDLKLSKCLRDESGPKSSSSCRIKPWFNCSSSYRTWVFLAGLPSENSCRGWPFFTDEITALAGMVAIKCLTTNLICSLTSNLYIFSAHWGHTVTPMKMSLKDSHWL